MSFAVAEKRPAALPSFETDLDDAIADSASALLAEQRADGHFAFQLEADATIPSEYVLLKHFIGEVDPGSEAKFGAYLRRIQEPHGGWPLVHGGPFNMSATVKAYLALKCIGDRADDAHMVRAREAVLAHGGASHCNVFTRITLALFGIVPWTAVPVMPVELMHAPRWFPVTIFRMSYWARDTLVPLLVLASLKPRAANPRQVGIAELFPVPADEIRNWPKGPNQVGHWGRFFAGLDRVLRVAEPLLPARSRRSATAKALAFIRERLNGEHGLGAIFPPIANSIMLFHVLGRPADDPDVLAARRALDGLLVETARETFCQPCLSPVWDTALSTHALIEAGETRAAAAALRWLAPLQVLDVKGDWAVQKPDVAPGGWAFQYRNDHYPDLDDTAVVVMAMDRAQAASGPHGYDDAIARGKAWVVGLQSRDGGWAAFDADNTSTYLNYIPFADHGALLDPPTADVTARVVSMLAQLGDTAATSEALRRGLAFLRKEQHPEGSWYGRWGVNFIYGTWSVLCALNAAGVPSHDPAVERAADWLVSIQNPDGGWGEGDASYALDYAGYTVAPSTASQTSWALLGLMAAGEIDHPAVRRGIDFLVAAQSAGGTWPEAIFTGTGFPRVFYLRYAGYAKFFPVWALARYRNLKRSNAKTVMVGL